MESFRHLDLNLLRVLVAIHRSGSVTEAARQLALSQPPTGFTSPKWPRVALRMA